MSNEGWERIRRPLPPDPPRGDLAAQFAALRHSVLPPGTSTGWISNSRTPAPSARASPSSAIAPGAERPGRRRPGVQRGPPSAGGRHRACRARRRRAPSLPPGRRRAHGVPGARWFGSRALPMLPTSSEPRSRPTNRSRAVLEYGPKVRGLRVVPGPGEGGAGRVKAARRPTPPPDRGSLERQAVPPLEWCVAPARGGEVRAQAPGGRSAVRGLRPSTRVGPVTHLVGFEVGQVLRHRPSGRLVVVVEVAMDVPGDPLDGPDAV